MSSSWGYETARQLDVVEGGFEGFDNADDQIFKQRKVYEKLVKLAAQCRGKYKTLVDQGIINRLSDSISDTSPEVNRRTVSRRTTRATGTPLDLPNVQPRVLERRRRRHSVAV